MPTQPEARRRATTNKSSHHRHSPSLQIRPQLIEATTQHDVGRSAVLILCQRCMQKWSVVPLQPRSCARWSTPGGCCRRPADNCSSWWWSEWRWSPAVPLLPAGHLPQWRQLQLQPRGARLLRCGSSSWRSRPAAAGIRASRSAADGAAADGGLHPAGRARLQHRR